MRTNYGIGQLSAAEKSDILDQHRSLYNGYQTMQPEVSNTQPLYVYDNAMDKEGLVVNNKGEVKKYTNMGINEQSKFSVKNMIKEGIISDGMIPKTETALYALDGGVRAVVILDGRVQNACLLELFTEHGAGSLIRN